MKEFKINLTINGQEGNQNVDWGDILHYQLEVINNSEFKEISDVFKFPFHEEKSGVFACFKEVCEEIKKIKLPTSIYFLFGPPGKQILFPNYLRGA